MYHVIYISIYIIIFFFNTKNKPYGIILFLFNGSYTYPAFATYSSEYGIIGINFSFSSI